MGVSFAWNGVEEAKCLEEFDFFEKEGRVIAFAWDCLSEAKCWEVCDS